VGQAARVWTNPLKPLLLNSTMFDSFKHADDSSLTIYLGKESPGADKEANWLPAPNGPFHSKLRL
jgi:hypothetical protein